MENFPRVILEGSNRGEILKVEAGSEPGGLW